MRAIYPHRIARHVPNRRAEYERKVKAALAVSEGLRSGPRGESQDVSVSNNRLWSSASRRLCATVPRRPTAGWRCSAISATQDLEETEAQLGVPVDGALNLMFDVVGPLAQLIVRLPIGADFQAELLAPASSFSAKATTCCRTARRPGSCSSGPPPALTRRLMNPSRTLRFRHERPAGRCPNPR
jgi:hypothetical protein